jgi:cobalamin biosynthesis protein CbiG
VSQLLDDWQSVELRLQAAWRTATECNKSATGKVIPSSFGRCPKAEWIAAEVLASLPKSQDVVGISREPGRGYSNPPAGSGCGS